MEIFLHIGNACHQLLLHREPIKSIDREEQDEVRIGILALLGSKDYISEYAYEGGYVLIGEDGAANIMNGTMAPRVQGRFKFSNHAHVIQPN